MAEYSFTKTAKKDLFGIIEHTRDKWGRSQTGVYINSIEVQCQMLASNPNIGKGMDEMVSGLLSYPIESHVIYYKRQGDDIVVIRVPHKRMLPDKHL